MAAADELDALIEELDQAIQHESEHEANESPAIAGAAESVTHSGDTDALDVILGSPKRSTQVTQLRNSDVVQQFRRDLLNGTVRIERLIKFLTVVGAVVKWILKR